MIGLTRCDFVKWKIGIERTAEIKSGCRDLHVGDHDIFIASCTHLTVFMSNNCLVLLFILKISSFPGLNKVGPRRRIKNIHWRNLPLVYGTVG